MGTRDRPTLRRTGIILLLAICSIATLGALVFGRRDGSGDAAGQGLARAFEVVVFVLGAGLVGFIALVTWLARYVRWQTLVMTSLGLSVLAIIILFY